VTQYVGWIVVGVGALCVLAWLVSKVAALWPGSVPSGVTDVADKIGVYADQTAGVAAWGTLKALAAKRNDEKLKKALEPVWVAIGTWDDEVEETP
jgi:hypothetical protein